ncbi:MAG: hypothetical protein H0T42_08475 [Deltaproteobacteria bacterium]|nr:hypothetical protein [Deltaproteobacteria bacterium]
MTAGPWLVGVLLLAFATHAHAQADAGVDDAPVDSADAATNTPQAGGEGPSELEATVPPPQTSPPPPSAEPDWDAAPPPNMADGFIRAPRDAAAPFRWVPRVLLFIPRWTLFVIAQPVRLAGWAFERYQLGDRVKQIFFNVDGTFGIFPVAFFETGFGLNFGARLVHKDLFGKRESIRLRAGFGGRFQQIYGLNASSGDRLGKRFALSLEARYERRDKDQFFGIGNGDRVAAEDAMVPIDPITNDRAVASRFRQRIMRVMVAGDARLFGDVTLTLSGALMMRRFEPTTAFEGENIADNYMTDRLVGFANSDSLLGVSNGVQNLYVEADLRYDTRRRASHYQSHAVSAAGWLLSGYFGRMSGVGNDPSSFYRYGTDLQRYIDLYRGSRVLALRILVEATGGTDGRIDQAIPFIDLPRLGGTVLRGYSADRFADRSFTLASVEYLWDMGQLFSAFTFADTGRVWRSLKDFELEEFRLGFGGGIQFHSRDSFVFRIQAAGSKDGDLLFSLALDPAFSRRGRAGRY